MSNNRNPIVNIEPILANEVLRGLALRTVRCVELEAKARRKNFGQALRDGAVTILRCDSFQREWVAADGPQFPEGLTIRCWMSVASQTRAWAARVSRANRESVGAEALASDEPTEPQPEQLTLGFE